MPEPSCNPYALICDVMQALAAQGLPIRLRGPAVTHARHAAEVMLAAFDIQPVIPPEDRVLPAAAAPPQPSSRPVEPAARGATEAGSLTAATVCRSSDC
jgi:hypothetical protein